MAVAEHMTKRPEHVKHLFDAKAPNWSAKYAPNGRLTGRLAHFSAILDSHVAADGHILDLGCGTGDLARAMAAAGMRVTACDISQQMLRCAVDLDPCCTVEWVHLDLNWRTLPFGSAIFDGVVAASVLEYVDEAADVLSECARVLRPGGTMVCTVPDPTHPVRWLEWLVGFSVRGPLAAAAARHWPRFQGYLTYLRISLQRHRAGWWRTAAARGGLFTVPCPAAAAAHTPLRMFVFQRPKEPSNDPKEMRNST